MRRHWAGEIAFVYQNKERNESVTLTLSLYIYGKWMEVVTYIGKIKRSQP